MFLSTVKKNKYKDKDISLTEITYTDDGNTNDQYENDVSNIQEQ